MYPSTVVCCVVIVVLCQLRTDHRLLQVQLELSRCLPLLAPLSPCECRDREIEDDRTDVVLQGLL